MTIVKNQIIWFPGIYSGRSGVYAQPAREQSIETLIELVQRRAQEDGEWSIVNGRVGQNKDIMHKMMEWVSRPDNITQCFNANPNETVDWICRDLANGSKWIRGSHG